MTNEVDPSSREALRAMACFQAGDKVRYEKTTVWMLEAGIDALSAMFKGHGGATVQRIVPGVRKATVRSRPTRPAVQTTLRVAWPVQATVINCYNARRTDRTTRSAFEHRWPKMDYYYCDLFTWALHPSQYATHRDMAQNAIPQAIGAIDLNEVAQAVAMTELTDVFARPLFRMKLLANVMDPVAPMLHSAFTVYYTSATDWWSGAYQALLDAAGLKLRPEVEMRTFAALMTAMEEGLAIRYAACPDDFGNDLNNVARTLATGALALLNGATAEPGDDTTLAQHLQRRFGNRPAVS